MKFTLSWLKEYIDTNSSLDEICSKLTSIGLEVESVSNPAETLKSFTVAEILETEPHPQADKLRICKVNTGTETLSIVCGAPNARPGIKIPLARIGTVIPTNGMEIKKSKIRGVESNGMLCSAAELGLSNDSEGILELPLNAEVGKPFAPQIGLDDAVIEIAITPNRGDCLGVYGVARDLAAAGLGELKHPAIKPYIGNGESPVKISIENSACKWFAGVYIKNVKNTASPEWLRNKLESIGKKPISALVDITNYLTFALNRPAHIYDADKLQGNIIVRNARAGEKLPALDNKEYYLNDNILVIADEAKPLGIAGVIGGLETGCTENTKNAFLEIAYFTPEAVANSGRALQIDSDARYRFERNIDYASSGLTNLAVNLITDICGGEASEIHLAGNAEYINREMDFDYSIIEKLTGMNVDKSKAETIFQKLGFISSGNKLSVPSWRNDISIPEDMAEEYARLIGYENIPTVYMDKPQKSSPALNAAQRRLAASRRILAGRGLNEVVSFSFMSGEKAKLFLPVSQIPAHNSLIEVANPISSDLSVMRPSILPNLLDAAANNQSRGKRNFCFFETGSIFSRDNSGAFLQNSCIAGIRSGIEHEKTPHGKENQYNVFNIKADLLSVISQYFDTSKLSVEKNSSFSYYHPGRSGVYRLGPNIVAVFGEIHPAISQKFDLKFSTYAFEIFADKLPAPKDKTEYARKNFDVSNFQAVDRDFAFIVNSTVLGQEILAAVRKAEIPEGNIEEVRIFDIYEGEKLGAGKKSIAFNVRIQPRSATLTDEQIENASQKIIESVRQSTGGTLRDS